MNPDGQSALCSLFTRAKLNFGALKPFDKALLLGGYICSPAAFYLVWFYYQSGEFKLSIVSLIAGIFILFGNSLGLLVTRRKT